jgi:hypothetical protein
VEHGRLRINHYGTKSREEYMRRISRGRADLTAKRDTAEFDGFQGGERHTDIQRFLPELVTRLCDEP